MIVAAGHSSVSFPCYFHIPPTFQISGGSGGGILGLSRFQSTEKKYPMLANRAALRLREQADRGFQHRIPTRPEVCNCGRNRNTRLYTHTDEFLAVRVTIVLGANA